MNAMSESRFRLMKHGNTPTRRLNELHNQFRRQLVGVDEDIPAATHKLPTVRA